MTLNDKLYTVTASDPANRSFTVKFNREDQIYKAHFPGQPVTPGVCIIQIASELFERLTETAIELMEVVNAKYLAIIDPTATPEVTYIFRKLNRDEQGLYKVSVEVFHHNTIYTKLSLVYKSK